MIAKLLRPAAAELVGTALFVFVGAGSVVIGAAGSAIGPLGVALAHGVALAILVSATLSISGGHLNPAVTAGLWLARKVDWRTAAAYVGAQLVGALVGALLVKLLYPLHAVQVTNVGVPAVAASVRPLQALGLETVLTFLLMSAVIGTAVSAQAPKIAGFGIGLAVFVGALVAGPLTGAALNPARAFGPALVAGEWHGQWVYWIGPLLGAALATLLWKAVLLPKDATEIR